MFIEGQLFTLSPEFMEVGRKPVGIFLFHDVERFTSTGTGKAVRSDSAAASDYRRSHQAFIEGRRNHGGLPVTGGAGDNHFPFIDGGIFFDIVGDSRSAPCPA